MVRSHVRRDDPLIVSMKLQMQPETDPAELQATSTETRAVQPGAGARLKERAALDHHLAGVRLKDRDLVERVVGSHDDRRERIQIGQADPVRL